MGRTILVATVGLVALAGGTAAQSGASENLVRLYLAGDTVIGSIMETTTSGLLVDTGSGERQIAWEQIRYGERRITRAFSPSGTGALIGAAVGASTMLGEDGSVRLGAIAAVLGSGIGAVLGGEGGSARQGAATGGLIGAFAGAIAGLALYEPCEGACFIDFGAGGSAVLGAMGLGMIGGAAGMIIGATVPSHKWEVAKLRPVVAPGAGGAWHVGGRLRLR